MPLEYSPVFEQAWAMYPTRRGSNPKLAAWQQWQARVREGVLPYDMIQGTRHYREWCEREGKVGTELVMQARRFYGKAREFAEVEQWSAIPEATPAAAPTIDIRRAAGLVQARRAQADGDSWWARMITQAHSAGRYRTTRDLLLYAAEQLEQAVQEQHRARVGP